MRFTCVFVTFPCGILGQVWYLIASIPDLQRLSYFDKYGLGCSNVQFLKNIIFMSLNIVHVKENRTSQHVMGSLTSHQHFLSSDQILQQYLINFFDTQLSPVFLFKKQKSPSLIDHENCLYQYVCVIGIALTYRSNLFFSCINIRWITWEMFKVSKAAKIRNRYNQVPHLTQDTNGKVTDSQLDTTNKSQEVRPFPAGDHKAHIGRRVQRHNKHKTEKTLKIHKKVPPWNCQ